MTSIRLGLIGAGGIARAHLSAASSLEGVSVTAVADTRAEACHALAADADAEAFASAEALLRRGTDAVDAVVICTPPNARLSIVRLALENSVAVLAEKPLAHTLEDAIELSELADTFAHVPTGVGYCHRFAPAVIEMKRLLAEGDLGRPVRFENVFACHFPAMAERWMSDRAVSGGGSFLDTGCHSLDLCQFVMGPTRVVGAVYSHCWPGRGESNATVLVRAGVGSKAAGGVICSGWAEAERFTVDVIGTEASLHYDYMEPARLLRKSVDGDTQVITVETHEVRFARQLRAFADAVGGGSHGALCTFAEAAVVNREAARSADLANTDTPSGPRTPVMASV
ncbi:MAG: Gfo/Idh/MocA family oxidoreductase [Planctomycetota bacterium]